MKIMLHLALVANLSVFKAGVSVTSAGAGITRMDAPRI